MNFKDWWKMNYDGSLLGEGFAEKAWVASRKDAMSKISDYIVKLAEYRKRSAPNSVEEVERLVRTGDSVGAIMMVKKIESDLDDIYEVVSELNEVLKEL